MSLWYLIKNQTQRYKYKSLAKWKHPGPWERTLNLTSPTSGIANPLCSRLSHCHGAPQFFNTLHSPHQRHLRTLDFSWSIPRPSGTWRGTFKHCPWAKTDHLAIFIRMRPPHMVSYNRVQERNSITLGFWLISTGYTGVRADGKSKGERKVHTRKICNFTENSRRKIRHRSSEISKSVGAGGMRGGGGGAFLDTPVKIIHKSLFGPGKASPRQRNQEKLQVVEQATQRKDDSPRKSNVMPSAQKASAESAQSSGPEGKASARICHLNGRCGRVFHGTSSVRRVCKGNSRGREKCRDRCVWQEGHRSVVPVDILCRNSSVHTVPLTSAVT